MNPDTTAVIRDIFVIVAAGAFAALCLALVVLAVKLYRPLRQVADNTADTTGNLSRITGDIAKVSGETAGNVADTARNAVDVSENLKAGTAGLPDVVQSVGKAADGIASVSDTATRIFRLASRGGAEGKSEGTPAPGVGFLLHLVRGLFGGTRRRGDDTGSQQES